MLRAADSAGSIVCDTARVWYRALSVLLIRRRRPTDEPETTSLRVIDGMAGAGRISAALLAAGVAIERMRQAVIDAGFSATDLEAASLDDVLIGDRFHVVVLGSHLVNVPEPDRRSRFLRFAARQLADRATLIVEHHPVDWADTAAAVPATPGGGPGMAEVRRHPPFVSAVSVFDAFGRIERQAFTARVLSDGELASELAGSGLEPTRRLSPTFLEARRAAVARQ
jgi:hypothetical protein